MSEQRVRVEVVRVFTDEEGRLGNELGIVRSGPATAGREQQLTRAIGFSETVFIDEIGTGSARIRIFTPAAELPFAGHPTVGAAWWLAANGTPLTALDTPAGRVAADADAAGATVVARPEWAPDFVWHELPDAAAVDALDPSATTEGSHYFYSAGPGDAIRSRMFAPALGVAEDQATGSAAVALAARLGRPLDITQGLGCRIRAVPLPDGFVELTGRVIADAPREL